MNDYAQLLHDCRAYVDTCVEHLRVYLIGGIAQTIGRLLRAIVVILLGFAALIFAMSAVVFALGEVLPMWASLLIMSGVFILLIIIVLANSRRLFVDPFVRLMSSMFYPNTEEDEDDEEY